MNALLIARVKHLETLVETYKKKVNGACEKFRDIKSLPGDLLQNIKIFLLVDSSKHK